MSNQSSSVLVYTDLNIADELHDRDFRNQFFRTEREIDIPAQLKTLRKFRKMRQEDLAAKVGTKQSAISRIERSQESNWELETLVRLAEALDARLSVIIEPYEAVAARYKTEVQSQAPSAATAGTEAQAPDPPNPSEKWRASSEQQPPQASYEQQRPLNPLVDKDKVERRAAS